jgi:hypothetical protein
MALNSSTSVEYGNPASVIVTVAETTGGGGNDAIVDVHVVVEPRFATPANTGHSPAGFIVTATTVSWLSQQVLAGTSKDFTAKLTRPANAEAVCSNVTAIVNGVYGGAEYYASMTPTVCFP